MSRAGPNLISKHFFSSPRPDHNSQDAPHLSSIRFKTVAVIFSLFAVQTFPLYSLPSKPTRCKPITLLRSPSLTASFRFSISYKSLPILFIKYHSLHSRPFTSIFPLWCCSIPYTASVPISITLLYPLQNGLNFTRMPIDKSSPRKTNETGNPQLNTPPSPIRERSFQESSQYSAHQSGRENIGHSVTGTPQQPQNLSPQARRVPIRRARRDYSPPKAIDLSRVHDQQANRHLENLKNAQHSPTSQFPLHHPQQPQKSDVEPQQYEEVQPQLEVNAQGQLNNHSVQPLTHQLIMSSKVNMSPEWEEAMRHKIPIPDQKSPASGIHRRIDPHPDGTQGDDLKWLERDPEGGYIIGRHGRWIMHPTFYSTLCTFTSTCDCEKSCPETRVLMAVKAYNRNQGTFRDMEALWGVSRSTIQRRRATLRNRSDLVYLLEAQVDETKNRGKKKWKGKRKMRDM